MKRLVLRRREEAVRGGQPVAFAAGLVFALVIGALLLTISGDPVLGTYQRMWDRSFGTADTLSATFNRAVPLALAGLAVSIVLPPGGRTMSRQELPAAAQSSREEPAGLGWLGLLAGLAGLGWAGWPELGYINR